MNYSLSVERLVRAMQMCACCEISKGTIHVVKSKSKKQYVIKTDKNGNEYYSLKLSEYNDETVEDFKELIKYFKFDCFTSLENKSRFDKILKSIKLILD